MPRDTNEIIKTAQEVLRGQDMPPKPLLQLAEDLQKAKKFGLARRILARARRDPAARADSAPQNFYRKLTQQQALCTYKDPDLPSDSKFGVALQLLSEIEPLRMTEDPETLGLAGAICKRMWEFDGQKKNLEMSLQFYLKGYQSKRGDHESRGWTGVNAAFVLDLLAAQENEIAKKIGQPSNVVEQRKDQARDIRTGLLDELLTPDKMHALDTTLEGKWWFPAIIIEIYFGLEQFEAARPWIEKAKAINDVEDWKKESTARQLAAIGRLKEKIDPGANELNRATLLMNELFGNEEAVRSAVRGKIGLALSGGGFRASLFHIGVLARLAELDLLKSVEVVSCVSGGSLVGAHYYLELRKLLQQNPDTAISKNHYVEIVKRMETQFLEGVQKNIRTRLILNPWKTFRMILSNYSRTERGAALFESHLYSRIDDGENRQPRWLNEMRVRPAGFTNAFNPKDHNWLRVNKVPMLILNAATLNTGHTWQFTATFMGEPPGAINTEVDANYRLRRRYYEDLPRKYQQFRLGRAVAASAAVPGIFQPIGLEELYEDKIVQLVDGGVHDNQGVAALLEQECSILLVSDASGQMDTKDYPPNSMLGVLLRSNDIFMARVRDAQHRELSAKRSASAVRGLMFVHLKKDLEADPIDWIDCEDPYEAKDDARPAGRKGPLTFYGIRRDIQALLAGIRTDLDSFCEAEAYALMTSGYRMTQHELARAIPELSNPPASAEDWTFLAVEAPMKDAKHQAHQELKKILKAASNVAFKVWKLSPVLKTGSIIVSVLLALTFIVSIYVRRNDPISVNTTVGAIAQWAAITLGVTLLFYVADYLLGRVGKAIVEAIQIRDFVRRILLSAITGAAGWLIALLHLAIFDKLYLYRGSLKKLGLQKAGRKLRGE